MRKILKERIGAALADSGADSPVFMFLPKLLGSGVQVAPAPSSPKADDKSLADLLEMFKQAKAKAKKPVDWQGVLEILERIQNLQPNDPYIIQQLALATYKSEFPGVISSLQKAKEVLEALKPDTSSDAETAGLWGAIHKRLWSKDEGARGPRQGHPLVRARLLHQGRLLQRDQLRLSPQRAGLGHRRRRCAGRSQAGTEDPNRRSEDLR